MVRKIYEGNKTYGSVSQLKKAIIKAWQTVDENLVDSLVGSMENKLFQVIQRHGGPIDY